MKRITLLILLIASLVRVSAQSPPETLPRHTMRGTYYSDRFEGRKTASGEVFRQNGYTAAHRTYKFGTLLLVTNPQNGRQVIVKVNDRCPKAGILDLSKRAARQIGITSHTVEVQILPESFLTYWEQQEHYLGQLASGTFLADILHPSALELLQPTNPLALPSTPAPAPKSAPKSSQKSTTPDTPSAAPQPAPQQPLYDLELCTIAPNSEPRVVIEKLPIHYRNRVAVVEEGDQLHIRLHLSMTEEEIQEVQRDLYPIFPRAKRLPQQR